MKYGIMSVTHKIVITVELEDVPPMTKKYGKITVQPLTARIDAQDGAIQRITLGSKRKLKNGELGADDYDDSWYWHDGECSYPGDLLPPSWMQELATKVLGGSITPSWQAHQAALGVTA